MAIDSLTLSAITTELQNKIIGGKINKITQPERDEIILNIYNKGAMRLLISANASVNRVHLTSFPTVNVASAPTFCMLLRKHITNSTIIDIQQMPYERVIDITLDCKNELGYSQTMHLIFELTGKTSNTILTNDQYIILDSIKHLPQDINSQRIILAGAKYRFFLPQDKIRPDDSGKILELITNSHIDLRTLLQDNLLGVSTSTVNEILHGIDTANHGIINAQLIVDRLKQYLANMGKQPNIVFRNGTPIEVLPCIYRTICGDIEQYSTLNEAHDMYYYYLDKTQRFRNKAKSTNTIIKNAIARTEKKIAIQQQGILDASTSSINKIYGDLILANLHHIKHGDTSVTVINYYDEQCPTIAIPLSPTANGQNNAQLYYKKYQKQKSTILHNTKLLEQNKALLDYLQSILQSLKSCNDTNDLADVVEELTQLGLVKKTHKKKEITVSKPLEYMVKGYKILVGKNNYQNNQVTFSLAKPYDIWIHTHNIHSSHVLILTEGKAVPNDVLVIACEICTHYSQASGNKRIEVDYTDKQNIKKPSKARLGYVIYNKYQSIIVDSNEHRQYLIH